MLILLLELLIYNFKPVSQGTRITYFFTNKQSKRITNGPNSSEWNSFKFQVNKQQIASCNGWTEF